MNTRAWAFAAMICALLVGAPTSLADEADNGDDGEGGGLTPLSPGYLFDPEDLEDDCTSMLKATFVSFVGTVYETDIGETSDVAYVEGERHTTYHTTTEFIRMVLDPFGERVQRIVDIVESSETVVEATHVEGVLHTEWERDLVIWERIERTVAVPLPAEGSVKYADSDVVSSCEADEDLSIEFPVYGGGHDMVWGEWYYEPYAPDTPEPEWIYEYIEHEFTPGVDNGTEYDEYRHAHCACPQEVEAAMEDYLRDLHPVVEETIEFVETVFVDDDDSDDAHAEDGSAEGNASDSAQAFGLAAFQAAPLSAKAGAGGVGLAGLLGSLLVLRRR